MKGKRLARKKRGEIWGGKVGDGWKDGIYVSTYMACGP